MSVADWTKVLAAIYLVHSFSPGTGVTFMGPPPFCLILLQFALTEQNRHIVVSTMHSK